MSSKEHFSSYSANDMFVLKVLQNSANIWKALREALSYQKAPSVLIACNEISPSEVCEMSHEQQYSNPHAWYGQ